MHSPIAFANSTALKEQCMCYKLMSGKSSGRDRIYVQDSKLGPTAVLV